MDAIGHNRQYPLTPTDMNKEQNDIDPASLEIFRLVLESKSGSRWFERYLVERLARTHVILLSEENGVRGYIKSYGYDPEFKITIKPEDSWLKKWIKRQLM
jgi:hypothetical protein